MRRLLAPLIIAAAVAGCSSLGSHQADAARASDVGTTAGAVVSQIPGASVVGTITLPITELAAREAERIAANTPADQPLSLWAQILGAIGAAGSVLAYGYARSVNKAAVKATDELYDKTHALAVAAAAEAVTPPNKT